MRGLNNNNYSNQGQISGILNGQSITGAERMSNGDILLLSTDGAGTNHLYHFDEINVAAMPIAVLDNMVVPISMARTATDELVVLDIDNDGLFGVNAVSGAVNFIGNVGFDANFGQGMAYDPIADKIIMAPFNAGIMDSELREVNPNTGATISLGTITPGVVDQFGWLGDYDDILDTVDEAFHNFGLYPNPASNQINLRAGETIDEFKIFTLSGQLVLEQPVSAKSFSLNVEQLDTGIYFIRVTIGSEAATYKLIKI